MMERDEAIAGHLAALECEDKMVIRRGVDGLIALAGRSPGLVPLLRELLSDPRRKHRWALAYVLGHVAPPAPAAVEALLEALGHPEPDIRWAVALLLIRLGKSHPAIAANLVALSRDGTATQRRMAVYCIRDVGVPGPPARAALVRALGDTDPLVRLAALAAFKNCTGPDAEVERLFLGLFLRDPHDGVRNAAAVALARFDAPSAEAVSALERAARGDAPAARRAAAAALARIKKRSAPAGR